MLSRAGNVPQLGRSSNILKYLSFYLDHINKHEQEPPNLAAYHPINTSYQAFSFRGNGNCAFVKGLLPCQKPAYSLNLGI